MKKNSYYQFFKDGETANIKIYGDIVDDVWYEGEVSALSFADELANLGNVTNIQVYINSYGGSVSQGLAIYNMLRNHPAEVTTVCDGFACSIASIIFMAGDKRVMNEGSILMIHEPWVYTMGNADELQKQIESLNKLSELSVNIYSSTTGVESDKISEMMKAETWITPNEAIELGFATEVKGNKEQNIITQSVKQSLMEMIIKCNKENNEVQMMENEPKEIIEVVEEIAEEQPQPEEIIESEEAQMRLEENKNNFDEREMEFNMLNRDREILESRGQRKLTVAEEKFYDKFIEACKSRHPQQAFIALENNEEAVMPETIIEDVFKYLVEEHPLLNAVNGVYAGYSTKWILNDHTKQTAAWGKVGSAIAQDIESAFKVIDLKQCKLSAFASIPQDFLELGKVFLDSYIRKTLAEAIACALEQAIISGNGQDKPVGLMMDMVGNNPQPKEAKAVTELSPKVFGEIVAELSVTEKGMSKKVDRVQMIVNNKTYLTKIQPAIQVLNMEGRYVQELPFPTDIIISNEVEDGKAIVANLKDYFLGLAIGKEGTIEFSDEARFLDDERVYKVKMFACGMAMDNNTARVLDVTGLGEKTIKVEHKGE